MEIVFRAMLTKGLTQIYFSLYQDSFYPLSAVEVDFANGALCN